MNFKITVSQNNKHVFTTSENTALTQTTAKKLMELLESKFPESEGYDVECYRWETTGSLVIFD